MGLRDKRGFTLAELLVVVLILGIIGMLVIPKFVKQPEKARQAVARADLKTIKSALEMYQIENPGEGFPLSTDVGAVLVEAGIQWTEDGNGIKDPWGGAYQYTVDTDRAKFVVCSTGQKEGLNWYVTEKNDPTEGRHTGIGGSSSASCSK